MADEVASSSEENQVMLYKLQVEAHKVDLKINITKLSYYRSM